MKFPKHLLIPMKMVQFPFKSHQYVAVFFSSFLISFAQNEDKKVFMGAKNFKAFVKKDKLLILVLDISTPGAFL